jgi:hypothetical protein
MEQGQSAVVRRTGTVVKRSGARVFILEDHQNPEVPEKVGKDFFFFFFFFSFARGIVSLVGRF